jgi:uncharacterized protein YfaS (alpha-2-macroglobulin family)
MNLAPWLRNALRAAFGQLEWQPPAWLRACGSRIHAIASTARAHPRQSALVAGVALALLGGAYLAWRWYESLPKPVTVGFEVQAPARTCYECTPPGKPNPLIVRFAASAAPLIAIGKTVDAGKIGLKLAPAVAGAWRWDDERTLRFQPEADWPIGQEYELALPRRELVAPQILLARFRAEFRAPAFEARVEANEFYQDPVQAADKKIVTTLVFSHAVDPRELEPRITLRVFDKVSDEIEREVEPAPPFTVTYDNLKLHAYVHSAQLPVPAKGGRALVRVEPGIRAARGGNRTENELKAETPIPGLDSLAIRDLSFQIVRDERDEPSQALMVETTHSVTEREMADHVLAWLLPERHPDNELQARWEKHNRGKPYPWYAVQEVTPAALEAATRVALDYVPSEREHVELHSFRFKADPGRRVYVRVTKDLRSFGGYRMPEAFDSLQTVPAYPQEVRIAHQGSLLALSGKRKLTIFSRDVPGLRVEVARLLPNQLQHLVSQTSGSFSEPNWDNWNLTAENLTEHFTTDRRLPKLAAGEPHYEAFDLGEFLTRPGASRLGIFLVSVQAWDPAKKDVIEDRYPECEDCGYEAHVRDTRLVLITDLGLLTKKSLDGSQEVFVQSIASGEPVAGVTVEIIGRNGETVLSEVSDGSGHVHFPDLKSFKREQQPVLYLARRDGDMSFLPMDSRARPLDLSRFDVGGVANEADHNALNAYIFSDRGLYRPGDEIRAGVIVRSQDWRTLPAGLPLRLEIVDPRGVAVKRDTLKLSGSAFEDVRYATRETSPAGNYTISLYVVKSDERLDLIGSTTVAVREFLPDRLRMTSHFSTESALGWVSPERLAAEIELENLFGTPASGRRITATLQLSPAFPTFAGLRDYQFLDPQAAKLGFTETLAEQTTDEAGHATLDLGLKRFARATYRAGLLVQGFEADGGRGVSNELSQLVSSLPYLIGWKSDGDLGYVPRGAPRAVELIAVDPKLKRVAVEGLAVERLERRYVSMLIRQPNGTYRYESRIKEWSLTTQPFAVAAAGSPLALDTGTPGNFTYVVRDATGQIFARVDYSVAGAANLSRSLEKNAELEIKLDKKDYAPGDSIEMQIVAPYTGSGLITIERDRVYAWRWFKSTTTSSVQTIRVPPGLEGNAYVQVTFVRDPASDEIYASPLSYGVQPFSIALDARRNAVSLDAPKLVKPGETLRIAYRTERPARIVLFAVDEGILQVALYRTPDPLAHFFEKRSLDVETHQILDLILPEFRDSMLAAPGGDEGSALSRHLNPFKRKTDKPVAWWSGILDADASEREVEWTVPETFNGELRLMAVAVSADDIGTAAQPATVRGDFVLSPNAPLTVTPGDEFDVSVGVANNVEGSGKDAMLTVAVEPSPGLEIVGPKSVLLPVAEMRESSARFHVRAHDQLDGAELRFSSTLGEHAARLTATLSIRPATPYYSLLRAGAFDRDKEVAMTRSLYREYRTLRASISPMPLALAHGLTSYLERYPYSCTEQIVSQALPGLVLTDRPEFHYLKRPDQDVLMALIDELRMRQTPEGAYRYWAGGVEVVDYVSVYAQHVLIEAAERGWPVPRDLLASGNAYLRQVAARDGNNLPDERVTAYAIYLLARQGVSATNETAALQKRLAARYKDTWRKDVIAAYLAATYELMKQHALAIDTLEPLFDGVAGSGGRWWMPMSADATLLYVVARHFPDRVIRLDGALLPDLVARLEHGEYQSLSAATTILALDAYARVAGARAQGRLSITAVLKDKSSRALLLPEGLFPRIDFPSEAATLRFGNQSGLRSFYLVEESGFDRAPPAQSLSQGLEVIREYLGPDGRPTATAKVGEELTVRIRFRAIGRSYIDDAVLIDLLPGGFDLVVPPNAPAGDCGCGFLSGRPERFPDYADLREDRVVLYGAALDRVQEFTYRIKATNAGAFVAPPAYGESMYEPAIRARSTAGRLVVSHP